MQQINHRLVTMHNCTLAVKRLAPLRLYAFA